jgi:hypothetical protein
LQLDREQRCRQRLACHVAERHEMRPLVDQEMIDEIATHVVRGTRVEPHVPAGDVRLVRRHQRELHGTAGFELVAGDELVAELEHQDDEQNRGGDRRGAHFKNRPPNVDPRGAEQPEHQRRSEQHAPRRRQLHQEAVEQPPRAVQPSRSRPELGHALPVGVGEVEGLERVERPGDRVLDATALHLADHVTDVVLERRQEWRRRGRRAIRVRISGRRAHKQL